jgi:hypothetical protein
VAKTTKKKTGAGKARPRKTLNLKQLRADLKRAAAAMRKARVAAGRREAMEPAEAGIMAMIAEIDSYCERDRFCGSTMIVPL